jgi:hypothetical protein
MVKDFAEAVMSADADAVCGAGYGERSPKRVNRRTLGFMNEMAIELRYLIADAGGLDYATSTSSTTGSVPRYETAANTSARSSSSHASSSHASSPDASDRSHFGVVPAVGQERLRHSTPPTARVCEPDACWCR